MKQPTDVAQSSISSNPIKGPLKWVGMENIQSPLQGFTKDPIPAQISALVSLSKEDQKGIHMSRIYELVQNLSRKTLNKKKIFETLEEMVATQKGSSDAAKLTVKAQPLLQRPALLSEKMGYKSYPMQIHGTRKKNTNQLVVTLRVEYSSTCPCSAALSREAIAEEFMKRFQEGKVDRKDVQAFLTNESTWPAWPHSQRSQAQGHFLLSDSQELPDFSKLADQMEKALGTPTQTAVKRVDEKEFARLNAQNLMFCEDAARRLKAAFQNSEFKDFKFWVRHFESLHSHDVYAESRK